MRITSAGNVGIGTTSPTYKFETLGTSVITAAFGRSDYGASNVMLIAMNGYRDVYKQAIGVVRTGDYDKGDMIFCLNAAANSTVVSASDEKMRITSGGELLINTTSDAGDYKLQVNGNVYAGGQLRIETSSSPAINIVKNATVDNRYIRFTNSEASSKDWDIINRPNANSNELAFYNNTDGVFALKLGTTGNGEFAGSIKTAAPSGGTAKPWKLGEAGVSVGGANTTAVKVEIDGVVYYLLTAYLPEPEPDPAALPSSGPSASYKTYNKPIPVKTTKDVEIDNLKKEIEELKQLIKNK